MCACSTMNGHRHHYVPTFCFYFLHISIGAHTLQPETELPTKGTEKHFL